jgi:hypothetical protein
LILVLSASVGLKGAGVKPFSILFCNGQDKALRIADWNGTHLFRWRGTADLRFAERVQGQTITLP